MNDWWQGVSSVNDDFAELRASLEWGANLELSADQRKELERFCCKIAGCVPRSELVAERKRR